MRKKPIYFLLFLIVFLTGILFFISNKFRNQEIVIKKYTNSRLQYSFSYPSNYHLTEFKRSSSIREHTTLKKDTKYELAGESLVLKKGVLINFAEYLGKDITEDELLEETKGYIPRTLKKRLINQTEGFEINQQIYYKPKIIYVQYEDTKLEIYPEFGSENTEEENNSYLQDLEEILSSLDFSS